MTYYSHHYVIDWERVKTLDDIKRLLAAMNITFEPYADMKNVSDLLRVEKKGGDGFTSTNTAGEGRP